MPGSALSLCVLSAQLCYAPLGFVPGRLQSAVRSQAVGAAGEARETLKLLAAAQFLHADGSKNFKRIDEEPPFQRRPRHGVPLAFEEEHREVETCPCYVKMFLLELEVRYISTHPSNVRRCVRRLASPGARKASSEVPVSHRPRYREYRRCHPATTGR